MEEETKLNIENWSLDLKDKIKYITSLENGFTYILTQNYFFIYNRVKEKENLVKYQIPENTNQKIEINDEFIGNKIWPDAFGIHIIFKIDGISYYYNQNFPEKKKIKQLKLLSDENKEYIEPFALSFNNINKNPKLSDEIIFTDINSNFYILTIKADNNGEIIEKLNKVINIKNINNKENKDENKENDELDKLDKLLEDNYFLMEKDDKIFDIQLYIKEEKEGTEKKPKIIKYYLIIAITKRIIFQFKGQNSINEVFSQYKKDKSNLIDIKKLLNDSKIFPKVNSKIPLENPRLQIKNKNIIYWNNEIGFTFWEIKLDKNNLIQKEFKAYKYITKEKEKNVFPLACVSISKCIYFLYNDFLLVMNTLTNKIIHTQQFKENKDNKDNKAKYLDMFYNINLNKIIIYSSNKIMKISIEHENDNLWKDYIQLGKYDLALNAFNLKDEKIKMKLHKLNADFLFEKKEYDKSAEEYAISDENFEHICIKFSKLNDIKYLIHYLKAFYEKKFMEIKQKEDKEKNEDNKEGNIEEFFIQKYLINTWLLELLLEAKDKKIIIKPKNNKNNNNIIKKESEQDLKYLLYDSGFIQSQNYIDKLIIFNSLGNYGMHDDFVDFAGRKNDYRAIIFDMVNHNKYKEAINNLLIYLSFDDLPSEEKDKYLKNLIKIFIMYLNIFVKESPNEVIELLNKHYSILENMKQIIRILINMDDIYDNKMGEEIFEKVLNLIRKLITLSKSYKNKLNFDDNVKQNLYNLYILYLSKSSKEVHFNELNEYLKKLIIDTNKLINLNSLNKNISTKQIFFEFSFAENLFKKNKSALALLYCLKKQYNKSIIHSFKCSDENISIFIANNIPNKKKKKEIWLALFNGYKKRGIKIVEEILQKSNGILTITDILPHLMGDVQLKDIETNLNKCIDEYEIKLKRLKKNIREYSNSEEILNNKINKSLNDGQKSFKFKLQEINCSICLKDLKEETFYIFPCHHAFDFNCIINILFHFNKNETQNEHFKKKMATIKAILDATKEITNKKFLLLKKTSLNNDLNLPKRQKQIKGFLRSFTVQNKINEYFDIDMNNEDIIINSMLNELDVLLNEECPLCGNELIFDTQNKFGDENNNDWAV